MATLIRIASENRHSLAADIRYSRYLDEPIRGGLSISCCPSGRSKPRDLPRERLRGRKPAAGPIFPLRPYAGPHRRRAGDAQRRIPLHIGLAQPSITPAIRDSAVIAATPDATTSYWMARGTFAVTGEL